MTLLLLLSGITSVPTTARTTTAEGTSDVLTTLAGIYVDVMPYLNSGCYFIIHVYFIALFIH